MFQQARDEHRLTIGDRINVDLDSLKEAINAQRATVADLADPIKLALKIGTRVGEINGEAANHVRRSHDHRIADALHQIDRLLTAARQATLGLQDAESIQERGEAHAILGLINRFE